MPVYEAIEEVIRLFNLNEFFGFRTAGILQAFLDAVAEFTVDNNADFYSFLDWWEINKEEFKLFIPDSKNAIKIMTIHKAKGLEFPVVIIPYADWEHRVDKQLWLTPNPQPPLDYQLEYPILVNYNQRLEKTYFISDLRKEEEKMLIDNINLLYVAFTRAIDNLYIISKKNRKSKNFQLLNEWLLYNLKKGEKSNENFKVGDPVLKENCQTYHQVDLDEIPENRIISNRWFSKISIRRRASDFWKFDNTDRAERRNWGILVHQILANIRSRQDLEGVVENALNSGQIDAKEKVILKNKIEDIFKIQMVSEWFNPQNTIFIESKIITLTGILRPDRIIVSREKVVVIDFKTGEKMASHSQQMRIYVEAIKTMGFSKVEAFILYLQDKSIVPVNERKWIL